MPRSLLISIRPTFVEQILTGTKTVELRRKKPQLRPGAAVYIYATAPVKAVVARAQLAGIVSLPRRACGKRWGLAEESVRRSFSTTSRGAAPGMAWCFPASKSSRSP